MSRLRNRNIRTKIQSVAKWGQYSRTTLRHRQETDSGIAESSATLTDRRRHQADKNVGKWDASENETGSESDNSTSSVNTVKVLDEIRQLQGQETGQSKKSSSAESYNSWTEEYESHATDAVRAEFERMERVLHGRETIPAKYDRDEYRLWIKTFPCLRIMSRTTSSHLNTVPIPPKRNNPNHRSKPELEHLEIKTPTRMTNTQRTHYNLRSLGALIENLYESAHTTTKFSNSRDLAINNTLNPRTLNVKMDNSSFLQLAPLNLPNSTTNPHPRRLSTNVANPDASRKQPNALRDNNFRCYQHNDGSFYTRLEHSRRKSSKTEPNRTTSEFIVLPPIEGRELRSVSAATISHFGQGQGLLGKTTKGSALSSRLKPVLPLYENDSDHDAFITYRRRKRNSKYK